MPEVGIEPTLPEGNGILNPARLPIPPLWLLLGVILYNGLPLLRTREYRLMNGERSTWLPWVLGNRSDYLDHKDLRAIKYLF